MCVSVRVIEKERESYLVFSQLSSTMPRAEYNSNPPLSQKPDDDDIKKMVEKKQIEQIVGAQLLWLQLPSHFLKNQEK